MIDDEEEEIVAQTPAFRVGRRKQGEFHLLRISGRFVPELIDCLRNKVFLYRCNYGLDFSGLNGITAPLIRELEDTAKAFASGEKRLVLVRPPEILRSMVAMKGKSSALEVVGSEDALRDSPRSDDTTVFALRELARLSKEFAENRHYQFIDREGVWICPFCGTPREEVRITSPMAIAHAAVEKAYKHLWSKCPAFQPTAPRPRPLSELQEALRRANDDKLVVPKTRIDRLETQLKNFKGRAEELEESVRKASERQRRLLPASAPKLPGAEIELVYRPAAVVSGDFYDFVPLDDGRTAFIVGDVSGHGIEAGIVMGMAKKVLAIRLQDYPDPIDALVRVNEDVDRELGRVSFVTAFVAIYDPAAKSLSCVRAGHNPPLLYHPRRPDRCLRLSPNGMGLGIVGQALFEPSLRREEVPLLDGDVLLLYTDGLTEAADAQGEQYGIERTIQVLESTYGRAPGLVLAELSRSLDAFAKTAVSEDDVTAVCVRFGAPRTG